MRKSTDVAIIRQIRINVIDLVALDGLSVFSSSLSESFPALRSLRARSWDMKKSKYTDAQIAFALKQAGPGTRWPR